MNGHHEQRIGQLLREALPPAESGAQPGRDLWPDLLRRLNRGPQVAPWFDWALLAGLVALAAAFPASIPMFLYYL